MDVLKILLQSINNACRDLPDGYIVALMMERDSAWVELLSPDGGRVDIDSPDLCLGNQIELATMAAITDAKELSEK